MRNLSFARCILPDYHPPTIRFPRDVNGDSALIRFDGLIRDVPRLHSTRRATVLEPRYRPIRMRREELKSPPVHEVRNLAAGQTRKQQHFEHQAPRAAHSRLRRGASMAFTFEVNDKFGFLAGTVTVLKVLGRQVRFPSASSGAILLSSPPIRTASPPAPSFQRTCTKTVPFSAAVPANSARVIVDLWDKN